MLGIRTIGIAVATFVAGAGAALGGVALSAPPAASVDSSGAFGNDSFGTLLAAQTTAPGKATCNQRRAFIALAAVESSVTGTSLRQILSDLQQGQTLDQIAGSKDADVKSTANGDVKQILDFMVANGKVSASDESADLAKASAWIDKAMALDIRTVASQGQGSASCGKGLGGGIGHHRGGGGTSPSAAPATATP